MKFEHFISEQNGKLDLLNEDFQDSNVLKDFLKSLKYVANGGKPPSSPLIELKDPRNIDKLRRLTNPTWDKADKRLTPLSKALEGGKVNVNYVAKNVYDIFKSMTMSGRTGKLETDVYNILSAKPSISKPGSSSSQPINAPTIDDEIKKSKIPIQTIFDKVRAVIDPAIRAGVLKWSQNREFSPQDLTNKGINKIFGALKQTAGEFVGQDMAARM